VNALPATAACVATAAGTLAVVSALARLRFRRLPGSFRCRLGPASPWRRHEAAWRVRRTRAVAATPIRNRTALAGPNLVATVPRLPRAPRGHGI
jgi:hypothetical protein